MGSVCRCFCIPNQLCQAGYKRKLKLVLFLVRKAQTFMIPDNECIVNTMLQTYIDCTYNYLPIIERR